ncbi:MAG: hypothetical protein DRO88_04040 [Promethearchaeia archaeon]|nr:MAG: hypothetical protein DRO88_04040 [Candidatus Lokiarchaeia archaeon]
MALTKKGTEQEELENSEKNKKNQFENIKKISSVKIDPCLSEFDADREKYLCQNISPELCKELRERKFTNKKEDLFIEVRKLEEEYRFLINSAKKKWDNEVEKAKKIWTQKYNKAIKNKQREINRDIHELEEEINKALKALQIQENMIMSQIDMLYKINKPKLTEEALKIMGLNYLCLDKDQMGE